MGKTQFQTTPIVILQAKYSPYQVQRIRASEDAVKDAQLKLLNPKTNTPEAQRLFDHLLSRHKRLLYEINDENSTAKVAITPKRKDGSIVYAQRQTEKISQQLISQQQSNKLILRRMAINNLRQAYKVQKAEEISRHVDQLTDNYNQTLQSQLQEAQQIVNTRQFASREAPNTTPQECLFSGKRASSSLAIDHDSFYSQQQMQLKERLAQTAQQTKRGLDAGKQRSRDQEASILARRQEYIQKKEDIFSRYPDKVAERDRQWKQRMDLISERAQMYKQKEEELLQNRISRLSERHEELMKKSEIAQKQAEKDREQAIKAEADLLAKRRSTAMKLLKQRADRIEAERKRLDKRDQQVQERVKEYEKGVEASLLEKRIAFETHSDDVRNNSRLLNAKREQQLRAVVELERSDAAAVQAELRRVERQVVVAEETFIERKSLLNGFATKAISMNEKQQIKALMDTLGCTENEAKEIIQEAKTSPK